MDLRQALGFHPAGSGGAVADHEHHHELPRYVRLHLLADELIEVGDVPGDGLTSVASGLIESYREKVRLLADNRCPADRRIEAFLAEHFADVGLEKPLRLPDQTVVLDRHGMARLLSIPAEGEAFKNELVESYRVHNGVLHNPKSDRRTTKGTFHVCEGGLPIPGDKKAVPKQTFAALFRAAFQAPDELMTLPFTTSGPTPGRCFVSLLLRPTVCPEVPGFTSQKSYEVRFFAPGSLVSNLDFVESIFGNAGDPFIPANDAGLDPDHWTGHTGCVILAPHMLSLTKRELGLPHYDQATERQRRDGMCWQDPEERYNDGGAFKLTCRTEAGVIITLIADNYFGYCKKEVKTQISYAANLFGLAEEEHAGGAVAYPSYNLGEEYRLNSFRYNGRTFQDVVRDYGELLDVYPEGYAVDKQFPDLLYIPEDAIASLPRQTLRWKNENGEQAIPLLPGKVYMAPSGYKLRIEKHPEAPSWRIIGTIGTGISCHKPCTVSGGGKSEISKSIIDYMHYGPIFVADIEQDMKLVQEIIDRDYSDRWDQPQPDLYADRTSRKILSRERSLGSVIKLLSPSEEYSEEYNRWLASIPNYIYALVFMIKRFYNENWGDDWRQYFGVDIINGIPGHELKYEGRRLIGTYLRVGLFGPQQWRTFKVRQDFAAASKVQTQDDITASVVVPGTALSREPSLDPQRSYKFIRNCEYRLFQRPDDAIIPGLDHQTEQDLSRPHNFVSNFHPLSLDEVRELTNHVVDFDRYSPPMQAMLRSAVATDATYTVCSSRPRIVDGVPTKNPRYLQDRPDMVRPFDRYVAERGTRLFRGIGPKDPLYTPVDAVLLGRRNNPPDKAAGIRSLAVYGPIHYQELPELFMDFVCSLTGKSPSTTGAGSEGALTKGPFNALRPTADLNNAMVSYILTGLGGFSTAAGHIGPNLRVDHDISLLIPEVWCRMTPQERDPDFLIGEGLLEKVEDFEYEGKPIPASRLGYRVSQKFVRRFFGRVFDNPTKVFDESILRPELQDMESFADGILNIAEAQQRVAQRYFEDGSIEDACPPLKAILHILAHGHYDGKNAQDPDVRRLFDRDVMLQSAWYRQRLATKQQRDISLWQRHVRYLEGFLSEEHHARVASSLGIADRLATAKRELERVSSPAYLDELQGTLGADPLGPPAEG